METLKRSIIDTSGGSPPVKKPKLDNVLVFCRIHPDMVFKHMSDLTKHCRYDHKTDVQIAACGLCDAIFDITADLSAHLKTNHRKQLLSRCPLCTYIPEKPSQLEQHRLDFHEGAPFYPCFFCPKDFNNTLQRREHEKVEHKRAVEENFCAICNLIIPSEGLVEPLRTIRNHYQNEHKDQAAFHCALCESFFDHFELLLHHEQQNHPDLIPERQNYSGKDNLILCPFQCQCDFQAKWPKLLRHHVKIVHIGFYCEECNLRYQDKAFFEDHMRSVHQLDQDYSWQCGICKEICRTEATREEHEQVFHAGEFHHSKCSLCGKIFSSEEEKTKHIDQNHIHKVGEVPSLTEPLPSNEKVTISEISVSGAKESKENEKPTVISSSFTINEREKNPFSCKLCSGSFQFYASLVCHIKLVHQNYEKREKAALNIKMEPALEEFPCDFCDATFPNNSQRNWHVKISHGIENFYPTETAKSSSIPLPVKKIKLKIFVKKEGNTKSGKMAAKELKQELFVFKKASEKGQTMNNDVNSNIFKCARCPDHQPVSQLKKLQFHMTSTHPKCKSNDNSFLCLACSEDDENRYFQSLKKLYQHACMVHDEIYQPFRCNFCQFGTKLKSDLISHKRFEHAILTQFKCDKCPTKFLTLKEANSHFIREHLKSEKDKTDEEVKKSDEIHGVQEMVNESNPKIFACSSCSDFKATSISDQLTNHFIAFHGFNQSGAQCNSCLQTFISVNELVTHVQECHKDEYQRFRCDFCRFGTDKKQHLKTHSRLNHSKAPNFSCQECSKDFFTNVDLTQHKKKLHLKKSKKYTCPRCDKHYKSLFQLVCHLDKVHPKTKDTIENPVIDSDDNEKDEKKEDKSSKRSRSERVHLFLEKQKQDPNDFKCKVCGLECKSSYRLMDHFQEVHVGVRPFICDGCGMSFSRKSNMTKHQRKGACKGIVEDSNATSEVPTDKDEYECEKCGKTFKYKQSYRQHMDR